jgi:hypothetical protein
MTVTDSEAVPMRRPDWQLAEVREIVVETPRVKSLLLRVPSWRGHPWPACRHPAHGRGRLLGTAELFARFASRR